MAFLPTLGPWLAGIGRGAANTAISGGINRLIEEAGNPYTREAYYGINFAKPNLIPPGSDLFKLYYGGFIRHEELDYWLKSHGAALGAAGAPASQREALWGRLVNANRPTWDMAFWRKLLRQGAVTRPFVVDEARRHGLRDGQVLSYFLGELEPIPVTTAIQLFQLGILAQQDAIDLIVRHGYHPNDALYLIQSAKEVPGIGESLRLLMTGVINEVQARNNLIAAGYQDVATLDQLMTLQNVLPSHSDMVLLAGRDTWDGGLANRWGMNAERPAEYDLWMKRAGLNYSAGMGAFGQPDPTAPAWSDLMWRAHWRFMSPETFVQIQRRVRGNPLDPATWSIPGLRPLDAVDIDDVYRIHDVAPRVRQYMQRLVYVPLGQRHLRMIVRQNPQGREWVVQRYQDMGYIRGEAEIAADALIKDVEDVKQRQKDAGQLAALKVYRRTVLQAYQEGVFNATQATSNLILSGEDPATAPIRVNTADIQVNLRVLHAVKTRAKQDWMHGRTSLAGASQRLLSAGMDPARVQQTIAVWQAERGEGRVVLSATKVLSMLRKGFIGPTEALTRLENLGIAQPDQMLLLSEAEAAIASDAADLAAAKDMALKKQIKEMDRLREKNAANLRGIAARMRQLTPPKQLAEWVARGEWDQDDAVNRLTLMGYDTGSINVLLADAARDKAGGPVSDDAKSQRIAVNLRRLTPPDKVTAWYRDGIWSEKQTRQRLALLGFPPDVIDAMIKEAEHQRPEAPAP